MKNNFGKLPYSDEKIAEIMQIKSCEFTFSPNRDEIKDIIKDYNLTLNAKEAVESLKKLCIDYGEEMEEYFLNGIKKLIHCIELR